MQDLSNSRQDLKLAGILLASVFGLVSLLAVIAAFNPELGFKHIFISVCHQQPHRSHVIDGTAFAVCVRCFWLYLGLFAGHIRFAVSQNIPQWRMSFLVIAGGVASLNWLAGWFDVLPDPDVVRAATSVVLGIAISHYSVPGVAELISPKTSSTPTLPMNHGLKRT
jgi:uncharacterized membrane protein